MTEELQYISSDRITVEISSRTFGTTTKAHQKYLQDVPPEFSPLAGQLRKQSALLALHPDHATREQVWAAYGTDLKLLQEHSSQFQAFMRAAIKCSVKTKASAGNDRDAVASDTYAMLEKNIPAIGNAPLLELSHIRAAKPADEQLFELQEEFEEGIGRLLRLFSFWLQMLVEAELVGLAEWSTDDVCRYHYFRHSMEEKVVSEKIKKETETKDNGWFKVTEIADETITQTLFKERHIHTVVAAKCWSLPDYPRPVPKRIAALLDEVPKWLMPLIRIVDGQMTMEEVVRINQEERTIERSEIRGVYEYEPGILLGTFNLAGFTLAESANAYYDSQSCAEAVRNAEAQHQRSAQRKAVIRGTITTALVITAILLAGLVVYRGMERGAERDRAAYRAYTAEHSTGEVLLAKPGDLIPLKNRVYLKYNGADPLNRSIQFSPVKGVKLPLDGAAVSDPADTQIHQAPNPYMFVLMQSAESAYYGDIDLGPSLGIFVKLHILSIKDSSHEMKYSYTAYADGQWNQPAQ